MTPLLLLLALASPPSPGSEHVRDGFTLNSLHCSPPVRVADRCDPRDIVFGVDTEDGTASLLLTERDVAFQLSDRKMKHIRRELRDDEEDDDGGAIGVAIKAIVLSTVRTMLDHSLQCRIRDLRDVEYEEGRLVFTTNDGKRIFDDMDVEDEDVTGAFSEHDARAFVREFHRLKQRLH